VKQNRGQSSAEALALLSRLRREGSLSDDEFSRLKQDIFAASETPTSAVDAVARSKNSPVSTFGLFVVLGVGLIFVDHVNGAILPDELYCAVGAGYSVTSPGRIEASAWSMNNGCDAYRQSALPNGSPIRRKPTVCTVRCGRLSRLP